MRTARQSTTSGAPRKGTLFCPTCGHASPIDGDWRVEPAEDDPDRVVYRCPDCGATIANRPREVVYA
ncbi:phage terminase large subunit family protein [Halococcus qingdaonensis]|uniref:phage terminase large subunit family protein n=1 Tax=Halococcus qingdaonensis TaxID=224402 RepID=UPI0021161DE3|nr:phage terminase large subunit family protein [Halococcus qingdaonensis]